MKVETFNYNSESGWTAPLPDEFDSPQTLVMAFGAATYIKNDQPFNDLKRHFPNSVIVGCSTAGEILGETLSQESIVGAVVNFNKTPLKITTAKAEKTEDSFRAGEIIAESLNSPDLKGVMVLSGGLSVNGSELVNGINSVLPSSVIVTGGLAGDKGKFEQTWALSDGKPTENIVSAIGFYGDSISIKHGSKGGWDIFGPERKVTKAKSNKLFELDGKPALELYKNYLGDRAAHLPASALLFPLGLRSNNYDEKRIVRTILNVDEEEQSLTFAGDVPEGAMVQLMRANFDRIIDGASQAALMTGQEAKENSDILSVAISCIGRRVILGERAEEELESVLDVLPEGTKQIGFYSFGELSPFNKGYCDLHNQTMTLTTISED